MKVKKTSLTLTFVLFTTLAFSQVQSQTDSESTQIEKQDLNQRHFIGSSSFILANAVPNQSNPPNFFQINYGYWLTKNNVISIEAITWRYNSPLGIPFGPSYDDSDEAYPGYIREFGIGLAYQRFLLKGLYSAVHAIPFIQKYVNEKNEKIQNGFQLFFIFRVGNHIRLFKDKWFLEPSIAFTYWPINTNVPESFAVLENKWPNYFLFEPGLHFGFKF